MGKHGEFRTGDRSGSTNGSTRTVRRTGQTTAACEVAENNDSVASLAYAKGGLQRISVLAAAPHQLMLRGIASVFAAEPDIHLQAQAMDGDEALQVIQALNPDVALLSLEMPGKGAIQVLEALRATQSGTRPVILAERVDEDEFLRATRLGVRGIVLTSMPPALLVRCVRMVHAGEEFIEKGTLLKAFGKLMRDLQVRQEVSGVLTAREHAVMGLAVNGLTNKDVARKLAITEGTVKAHLHRAYTKLGVSGRIGLFRYAQERGLV